MTDDKVVHGEVYRGYTIEVYYPDFDYIIRSKFGVELKWSWFHNSEAEAVMYARSWVDYLIRREEEE